MFLLFFSDIAFVIKQAAKNEFLGSSGILVSKVKKQLVNH